MTRHIVNGVYLGFLPPIYGCFCFFFYYPFIRRTWTQSVAVIMWVGGRWCSAAWGRKIGQSCWSVYSCSSLQREAPGRPEPGA